MKRPVVVYGGPADWYRRPMMSADEVMAGPKFETVSEGGRQRSVATPTGAFDMARLAAAVGPDQRPDGYIVQANRSGQAIARNLHALDGPKVLAVGDTHHMSNPISYVLDYAHSAPFDAIIIEFNRQHAHWFIEAGFENVHWLPLFSVNPRQREIADRVTAGVAMIGALGDHHPHRRAVVDALRDGGVPVATATLPQDAAADAYASTAVTLNVSLNGDLNLRIVEALAAGACLLTDQLSPQAGLEQLFEAGRELETYRDAGDAVAAATALLADPTRTLELRQAGRERALSEHSGATKAAHLQTILDGGAVADTLDLRHERRCRRPVIGLQNVLQRVRVYEAVQEFHRPNARCRAIVGSGVDPLIIGDLVDLPRLQVVRLQNEATDAAVTAQIAADGVEDQVAVDVDLNAALEQSNPTVLVVASPDVDEHFLDCAAASPAVTAIIVADLRRSPGERVAGLTAALARRGFQCADPAVAFVRASNV